MKRAVPLRTALLLAPVLLTVLRPGPVAAQDLNSETAAKSLESNKRAAQSQVGAATGQNPTLQQSEKSTRGAKSSEAAKDKDEADSKDAGQGGSQQKPDGAAGSDQKEPIQSADDLKNKLTFSVYFSGGDKIYDLNMRHQFGHVVAWVAGYFDPRGANFGRVGAEYDFQHKWLLFIPTLEVGTNGAVAGSLYSELGGKTYAIAGYSRTNLKNFFDLFFDPGDSVQLGAGRKLSDYDNISGYVIFDVRLHTHQQDTHVKWRHKLNASNGITFDAVYKSGYEDTGKYIRTGGIGVYYDRPHWFWKLYYDPHVNFTRFTMVRAGIGLKF